MQSDIRPGDRGGPGPAVRLDNVTVHRDGSLAQSLQVGYSPQRPPNEPLDLLRAPVDTPSVPVSGGAGVGGAGQHGVFSGHPTLALASQERRHPFFQGDRAQHFGVAHFYQRRAFGELLVIQGDISRPAFIPSPTIRSNQN